MKVYITMVFLIPAGLLSAQNLIFNPSFEEHYDCPFGGSQLNRVKFWYDIPGISTTDYFNSCDLDSVVSTPENIFGYQNPLTGNAYIGIYCSAFPNYNDIREYPYAILKDTLVTSLDYYISLNISLAEKSTHAVSHIGFLLAKDIDSINYIGNVINEQPNFESVEPLKDSHGWTRISSKVKAVGGETTLILGTFHTDSTAGLTIVQSGNFTMAYYYIDDVCVSLNPADCGIDTSTVSVIDVIKPKSSFSVFPNPAKDRVTLMYLIGDNQNLNVEITNTLGQVMEQNISLSEWGLHEINTSNLQGGVYFIKLLQNDRLILTHKLIVE